MTNVNITDQHGAMHLGDILARLSSYHTEVAVENGIVVAKMRGIDAYVAAEALKARVK